MSLTPTQEAQVLALIAEEAALLSLADNEASIISNLGATDVSLSDLTPAASVSGTDLILVRQGTTDKSATAAQLAAPDATDTVKGIVSLGVAANYPSASDTEAATPAYVSSAVSAIPSAASSVGTFRNLSASANGTSANISIAAVEIILETSGNAYKTVRAVSLTLNTAGSGANGLDTGTLAANTWYYKWVINNGTTTAALASLSATAPTMPSGYTYKARHAHIRNRPI